MDILLISSSVQTSSAPRGHPHTLAATVDDFDSNSTDTNLTRSDALNSTSPLRPRDQNLAQVEVVLQATMLIMNVVGNGAVLSMLVCMSRDKSLSRMYTMIGHLSCADLFVAVFNILPQLLWDVTERFKGGRVVCKLIKYGQVAAIYAPAYVLVSTALDRYIAICHPMRSHTWTSATAHRLVALAWLIALAFATPQLAIFDYVEVRPGVFDCWEHFSPPWTMQLYITCFTLAVYIVPLFFLIAVYTKICLVVWTSSSDKAVPSVSVPLRQQQLVTSSGPVTSSGSVTSAEHNGATPPITPAPPTDPQCIPPAGGGFAPGAPRVPPAGTQRGRREALRSADSVDSVGTQGVPVPSRARTRTVKLTLTVVVSYLVCWGPFFFAQMWYAWDPNSPQSAEETAMVLTLLLASLNSCTNPWIYLAFSDHLRRRLRRLCCCCCCCCCCCGGGIGGNQSPIKLSYSSTESRFGSRHRTNR